MCLVLGIHQGEKYFLTPLFHMYHCGKVSLPVQVTQSREYLPEMWHAWSQEKARRNHHGDFRDTLLENMTVSCTWKDNLDMARLTAFQLPTSNLEFILWMGQKRVIFHLLLRAGSGPWWAKKQRKQSDPLSWPITTRPPTPDSPLDALTLTVPLSQSISLCFHINALCRLPGKQRPCWMESPLSAYFLPGDVFYQWQYWFLFSYTDGPVIVTVLTLNDVLLERKNSKSPD